MIRVIALVVMLAAPAGAGQPLVIIVDGQAIGTLAAPGLEYDIAAGTIAIHTNELVYGCRHDRIFADRFD